MLGSVLPVSLSFLHKSWSVVYPPVWWGVDPVVGLVLGHELGGYVPLGDSFSALLLDWDGKVGCFHRSLCRMCGSPVFPVGAIDDRCHNFMCVGTDVS